MLGFSAKCSRKRYHKGRFIRRQNQSMNSKTRSRRAAGFEHLLPLPQTRLGDKYRNTKPTKKMVTFKGVVFQINAGRVRVVYSHRLACVRITSASRISMFMVEEGHHYANAKWHTDVKTIGVKRKKHCFSLMSGGLHDIHLKAPEGSAYVREHKTQPGVFMPFSRTNGCPFRQFVCCQCNAGFRTFPELALHSGISKTDLVHW